MIIDFFKRFTAKAPEKEPDEPFPAIAPERMFYAVGDIHGRLDLLERLMERLNPEHPVVFVGDYIDRGGFGAQVLRFVQDLEQSPQREVICLLGNHEEMLLRFVDDPFRVGRLWLQNGGVQTLASFGLIGIEDDIVGDTAARVSKQLREAMGEDQLDWLRARPLIWQSGNVAAVHAALDPSRPVESQERRNCLWGHPNFPRRRREDGQWVVHGHTIVPEPVVGEGVVSIDTGAFATDRLTAAVISSGKVQFVSTQ